MRRLVLTILAMGIVLAAGPARAQRYDPAYPVCLYVVSYGTTPYYRCSYTSMDECRASANGQMCSRNPLYANASTPVRRNNRRSDRQATRSYAPPKPPIPYRAAPSNQRYEPYYGASQGYAPGEKEQFLNSLRWNL